MKKILLFFLGVTLIGFAAGRPLAADEPSKNKVVTYYFHGTFRCPTCTNMEKYVREAIEVNFKDALASGSLEFKTVNVEEPGNEHFAGDYQLYTKSLVLSLVKNGKEVHWRNLEKIWEYSGNKQKFMAYIVKELNKFLKETQ